MPAKLHWRGPVIFRALNLEGQRLAVRKAERIADLARPNTPVDTGELRGSLFVEENERGATVGYTADHAKPVERRVGMLRDAIEQVMDER